MIIYRYYLTLLGKLVSFISIAQAFSSLHFAHKKLKMYLTYWTQTLSRVQIGREKAGMPAR